MSGAELRSLENSNSMKTVMKMFFSGQTISQADLITAILTNNPAVRINGVQQFFVASFKVLRFFHLKQRMVL